MDNEHATQPQFAGCFRLSAQAQPAAEHVRAMLSPDGRDHASSPVSLAACAAGVVAGSRAQIAENGRGLVVAVSGRCAWSNAELDDCAADRGQAAALMLAYERYGIDLLTHIGGHFAIAVGDGGTGTTLLANDRIGTHRLYFADVAGLLVFGTRLGTVVRHPGIARDIDPQAVYDYLYFHCIPSPRSIYRGIFKLAPAQRLLARGGTLTTATYWLPGSEGKVAHSDRANLAAELRDVLQTSVAAHAGRSSVAPGAFLSGGLDSSTVAGCLARTVGRSARTYTIGFETPEYDESRYARITAQHFGTSHHEYFVSPADVLAAVPRIAAHLDEPFGNSSAVPVYYCARAAREKGTDALLAGDGGDELFAGNERYGTQHLFEMYFRLPAGLRRFAEGAYAAMPPLRTAPIARKGHRYIVQAKIPLPDRLQRYNFMHRFSVDEVLEPDLLPHVDTQAPLDMLRGRYREVESDSALNRMLYLDWKFTLADNDLVKVNEMCALAGITVTYPMLEDAVIDLAWRIPPEWKMPGMRLRHFYKQAMAGFLANETLRKSKRGFGLPFGVWLRTDAGLRDLAEDSLRRLRTRGLIRAHLIDQALALHRDDTARYYGELVWILMMLELWIASHG